MRVLIAVASKHGGTLEIATRVGGVLTARGHPARVQDAATVQGLGDVDAVVLSSAIYFTRWLPAAVQLVERHEDGLRDRPVWLFSSGLSGDPAKTASKPNAQLSGLLDRTGARSHRLFGGRLDRSRLNLWERLLVKLARSWGDETRDWSQVERWANDVADELDAVASAGTR